jgi:uncharacterized DUF497 family protein
MTCYDLKIDFKLKVRQMKLEWDDAKRQKTVEMRGLDFADAALVFKGDVLNIEDNRNDYGENRIVSVGFLDERMVRITWTQRGESRRIISMRKANEREIKRFSPIFR